MIKFIDLSGQIYQETGDQRFAFYNTITDRFEKHSSACTWESVIEFKRDFMGNNIDHYLALVPEKFR